MQSAEERRRLMNRLGTVSITPLAALLKCAAGLVLLGIVAAGPWAFLATSGPEASAPTVVASKAAESEGVDEAARDGHEGE